MGHLISLFIIFPFNNNWWGAPAKPGIIISSTLQIGKLMPREIELYLSKDTQLVSGEIGVQASVWLQNPRVAPLA